MQSLLSVRIEDLFGNLKSGARRKVSQERFSITGPVLMIAGSRLASDHLEHCKGFDAVIAQNCPHLEVVASIEWRDDPDLIQSAPI